MKNTIFRQSIRTILLSFSLLFFAAVQGQVLPNLNQPSEFWKHVRFGGGVGMSFGDGYMSGTLAPSAIYQVTPQFAMGVGLNGTINKRKNYYKSTILGGSLIALYNIIPELQISGEFEELHVTRKWETNGANITDKYWYPALFLGAGFRTGNVTMGIKYDVLHDNKKSIYAEAYMPFVRVYF